MLVQALIPTHHSVLVLSITHVVTGVACEDLTSSGTLSVGKRILCKWDHLSEDLSQEVCLG